jgi:hypothetical protein
MFMELQQRHPHGVVIFLPPARLLPPEHVLAVKKLHMPHPFSF